MKITLRKRVKLAFLENKKSRKRASNKKADEFLHKKLTDLCKLHNAEGCTVVLTLRPKNEEVAGKVREKYNAIRDELVELRQKNLWEKGESSPCLTSPFVFYEPMYTPMDTPMGFNRQMQSQNLLEFYRQIPQRLMEYNQSMNREKPVQVGCQFLYDFYAKLPQKLREFNKRYNLDSSLMQPWETSTASDDNSDPNTTNSP